MRAYPRTGGETLITTLDHLTATGLSPHGRGNLPALEALDLPEGPIPARAGKPYAASL